MTQVDVGDVVLVRTLLQISIYVSILLYREERFLPATNSQKLYTILQGNNCVSDNEKGLLTFRICGSTG